MLLKDKVVVVTGLGPGMSGRLATLVAAEGGKVVMASRSEEVAGRLVGEIRSAGGDAVHVKADVSRADECQAVAAAAIQQFGRIDGLVNSAYYHPPMLSLLETSDEEARKCFDVIFFGALHMIRAVTPAMKRQGGGSIVNIGTMAYRKPFLGEGAYAAAKSAVATAARYLALELGPYNIRCNQAVMGWLYGHGVQSYLEWQAQLSGLSVQKEYDRIAANIALNRIPSDQDCAKTVLMLLSDYCSEVTGASIDVNGGEFMPM